MKNSFLRYVGLVALLICCPMAVRPARADLLTSFSFNNANFLASDGGIRSSTLTTTFPSDSIDNAADGQNFNPNSPNRDNALEIFNLDTNSSSNQGRTLQFAVNTSNYRNLIVTLATQNESGGFNSNAFQYSSDGTNFTTLRSYVPTAGSYGTQTFDFSNITTINNNASTAFRIVFNGGSTTDSSAANYLDNLILNGSSIAAVPEPSTWAMMALGATLLGIFSTRRKRDLIEANGEDSNFAP